MVDLLKKTFFSSIGLAYLTKEKLEETGRKLAKEINLSEEEGRKFVDELKKKTESARGSLEKFVKDTVEATLKKLDIPTRQDMAAMQNRMDAMEKERKQKVQ